jgi:hypothetical protein
VPPQPPPRRKIVFNNGYATPTDKNDTTYGTLLKTVYKTRLTQMPGSAVPERPHGLRQHVHFFKVY